MLSAAHDSSMPSRRDSWWLLPQLVPTLKDANMNDFPYGEYFPKEGRHPCCIAIDYGDVFNDKWRSDDYEKDMVRINRLREALGIPEKDFASVVVGD